MGHFTEEKLEQLVTGGCSGCQSRRFAFKMYVDGLVPLQGGEPVGPVKWCYDGEKFVDGIYEIRCSGCEIILFAESSCPRCHAADGLAKALATPNEYPVPSACPECDGDEVRYIAMIPARTIYEGKRAEKARTSVEIGDLGFHGYRVDCRDCGKVREQGDCCPMCGAAAPLRDRPV